MLTFRILGPIEVQSAGRPVEIKGSFQQALLAALLVNGGRQVLTDSLIDELWEQNPPRNAENALQAHISRLRRRVRAAEPGAQAERFVSMPSGYRVRLEGATLDADAFLRTLAEVRGRPDLDPVEVITKLRGALSLWRGPIFGGSVGGPICQAAAARFAEHHAAAMERLYDYELLIGRHDEVVAELSQVVASRSLNERLAQQLMIALYRCGRQTDALAVYRRMRIRLMDELGVDPSPMLRNCQRDILAHDPALQPRNESVALRLSG